MIADYGTHVITTAKLGARIEVHHWVKRSATEEVETKLNEMKVEAQVSAMNFLKCI